MLEAGIPMSVLIVMLVLITLLLLVTSALLLQKFRGEKINRLKLVLLWDSFIAR